MCIRDRFCDTLHDPPALHPQRSHRAGPVSYTHLLEQEKTIAQIDDVQTQIDETQEQIEEKQQELEDKQNVLAGRVSDSYKDGPGSTLKLLLAAKSFDELLSNSRYVEKINDACLLYTSMLDEAEHVLRARAAGIHHETAMLLAHLRIAHARAAQARVHDELTGKVAFGTLERRSRARHVEWLLCLATCLVVVHRGSDHGRVCLLYTSRCV